MQNVGIDYVRFRQLLKGEALPFPDGEIRLTSRDFIYLAEIFMEVWEEVNPKLRLVISGEATPTSN